MKIRQASPYDMPYLLDMLRQYQNHTPLVFLQTLTDAEYITVLLTEIMVGKGVIFVAEKNDIVCGMLIAGIAPSIWSPKHFLLREFAYWVNEDARFSSAGARLLLAYMEYGEKLKEEGRIEHFTISKMSNSPDLKFDRYGFEKIEEFWGM
jgi:N-acetylglutamate synthase-like GNAT family acetyltransferase